MNKPEVIQGRLGWESGDISEATPGELKPHPKNREIYGDTESPGDLDATFKESVAEKGVLEPLVITAGKQIVSGHRRWLAATAAGLEKVPVRYAEFDSELVEREALIEFNRQRDKSDGQKYNEAKELLEIKRRQGKENQGDRTDLSSERTKSYGHDSWEEVAETVGASSTGLKRAHKVEKLAHGEDTPDNIRETAREQLEKLQSGDSTFYGAAKAVEKAEAQRAVAEQEQPETDFPPIVRQQDAVAFLKSVGSADLVIADPPYSTEIDDIVEFASSWVKPLVEAIGDGGRAFVFIGAYPGELQAYLNVLNAVGVLDRTQVLVWAYRNTLGQSPNEQYKQNWQAVLFIQSKPPIELDAPLTTERWAVQDVNAPDARTGERHHEWEKPGELIRRFIRHTTEEGDFVVDPFVGTGTTVLEASNLGRETMGCDTDPEMLKIAKQRGCVIQD